MEERAEFLFELLMKEGEDEKLVKIGDWKINYFSNRLLYFYKCLCSRLSDDLLPFPLLVSIDSLNPPTLLS
jgi:hypothetical protein